MLHVHRAERADGLVEALRGLLAEPLDDPFAPEVVAVPTRGHGALAHAADVRPARRVARPRGRRVRERRLPVAAPPRRRRGRGRLGHRRRRRPVAARARGVAAAGGRRASTSASRGCAALSHHLGGGPAADPVRRARRLATLRHLADLFDRYALHRPEMVRGVGARRGRRGGVGRRRRWQAELWRRLRARIGVPEPGRAARRRVRAAARASRRSSTSRRALSLFGLTRLPAGHLQRPAARSPPAATSTSSSCTRRPALWERIARRRRPRRSSAATTTRPPSCPQPPARLLGPRRARDAARARRRPSTSTTTTRSRTAPTRCSAASRPTCAPTAAARRAAARRPDERPLLDAADRSVQVHACHGRARQVEVLRDAILHLLEDDPTLEPRDVIVMCPDIETFAPLIQATFGAGEVRRTRTRRHAARRRAPARPARPPRRPLAAPDEPGARRRRAAASSSPASGVTASQVLDLADREPVRRRFGLDDDDLARIEEWVADSGIRWGLDAAHRAPFKLDALPAGTWRAGLDRVLRRRRDDRGAPAAVRGRPPARRRRQRRDRSRRALRRARRPARRRRSTRSARPQPIDAWADGARRRRRRAHRDRPSATPGSAPSSTAPRRRRRARPARQRRRRPLALAEIRALLAERLQGRPTRANFRTGHLTICTLMPMRSVPHRVVCLLGHRRRRVPAQVPARRRRPHARATPHVGDRDPRSEDRQLLLDALLAADRPARRHLHGQRRAHERPAPAGGPGRRAARRRRPHGPRGRRPGARAGRRAPPAAAVRPAQLRPGRARRRPRRGASTRSRSQGARALAGERAPTAPFLARSAAGRGRRRCVELDDLVRFVEHPVRAFLRQRLGISVGGLQRRGRRRAAASSSTAWRSGASATGCSTALLAGAAIDACVAAEIARGALPPGRLALPVIARVRPGRRARSRPRRGELLDGRRAARLRRRPRGARRRPRAGRHGPRRLRRRAADRHLLARRARGTASRRGCACWR